MDFASKTDLTRYGRDELLDLRQSKSAQKPPPYPFSQNIIRLGIQSSIITDEQQGQADKFKELRDAFPSLTTGNLDPNLLKLLDDYHRSLLYPHENVSYKGKRYEWYLLVILNLGVLYRIQQ